MDYNFLSFIELTESCHIFLCTQTRNWIPIFISRFAHKWIQVVEEVHSGALTELQNKVTTLVATVSKMKEVNTKHCGVHNLLW